MDRFHLLITKYRVSGWNLSVSSYKIILEEGEDVGNN